MVRESKSKKECRSKSVGFLNQEKEIEIHIITTEIKRIPTARTMHLIHIMHLVYLIHLTFRSEIHSTYFRR